LLRHRPWRALAKGRGDCRLGPQGRKACRHPDRAADQVRACRQSEDRQGPGTYPPADDHDPGRRRHRMIKLLIAVMFITSNRIEYAKASPEGYEAFGGVYVY